MCFSATASFGASAVLMGGGIVAIKRTQSGSQIPFAVLPLLFSAQQCSEGFVWLSLTKQDFSSWNAIATYVFVVFAQVLWPTLVPFSIWLMEKDSKRKKILASFIWVGLLVSVYMIYGLLYYDLKSYINGPHIHYDLSVPGLFLYGSFFYFIATVPPSFFSTEGRMNVFGSLILGSLLISKLFFHDNVVSVWCFFAAIISLMIIIIVRAPQTNDVPLPVAKV